MIDTAPRPLHRKLLDTLRRSADRLEGALRGDDRPRPDQVDDTRELLRPNAHEKPSRRARRQARDYLERRRRKLAEDLGGRGPAD